MAAVWIRVLSVRRALLGVAGLLGAVLALTLALRLPVPEWDGPGGASPGLLAVFAGRPRAASAPASPGAAAFGSLTLLMQPRDRGARATLYRDGIPAGSFAGGPLTLAVRAGDVISVALPPGVPPARVRILGTSPDVLVPGRGEAWPLDAGKEVLLPPVRLRPPVGPGAAAPERDGAPTRRQG